MKNENDVYKTKLLGLQEQKIELIEILNSKHSDLETLQKDHKRLKDEYEHKLQKLEPSTRGSSSFAFANSESISTLFKLMNIEVTNGRN